LLCLTETNVFSVVFQLMFIVLKVVFDLKINTDIEFLIRFIKVSFHFAITVHKTDLRLTRYSSEKHVAKREYLLVLFLSKY